LTWVADSDSQYFGTHETRSCSYGELAEAARQMPLDTAKIFVYHATEV
jgi:hypothetical protein